MTNEERTTQVTRKLATLRGQVAHLETVREAVGALYHSANDYVSEHCDGSQVHQEVLQMMVFTASAMNRIERHYEVAVAEVRVLERTLDTSGNETQELKAEVNTVEIELP